MSDAPNTSDDRPVARQDFATGTRDASPSSHDTDNGHTVGSDRPFYMAFALIGATYVVMILLMLLADFVYMIQGTVTSGTSFVDWLTKNPIVDALRDDAIRYSIALTLISCTITAILSVFVAVPIGYLMSRHEFRGRNFLDAVLDIPIVLPPLVVGLSLLIVFQYVPPTVSRAVVYEIPAVVLAQFMVACAFAVRTMRATFDQIDARREQVALTLGCTRAQAFGLVVLPEARRGVLTAATLAWARALGEFGPLLIFAGATRRKTEVLSTTVFLELSVGDIAAAVAVSLIMVFAAVSVLIVARLWGSRSLTI